MQQPQTRLSMSFIRCIVKRHRYLPLQSAKNAHMGETATTWCGRKGRWNRKLSQSRLWGGCGNAVVSLLRHVLRHKNRPAPHCCTAILSDDIQEGGWAAGVRSVVGSVPNKEQTWRWKDRRKLPEIMGHRRSIISSHTNAAASPLLGHSVIKAQ